MYVTWISKIITILDFLLLFFSKTKSLKSIISTPKKLTPNRTTEQMTMRSNRLALVILNLLFHSNLYVGVVVDAFLSVNVGVSTVVFNKPSNEPLSSRFADSSLSQKAMFFTSSSRSAFSLLLSLSSGKTSTENDANKGGKNRKKRLYSFSEARKIARGHGFGSKEEFIEYDCAGAYQLPKNADEVWSEDWTNWENFLGVPIQEFEEAREIARTRVGPSSVTKWKASTEDEYKNLFEGKEIDDDDIASRLPYRPDLKYKNKGWISWENFLQPTEE